MEPIIEINWTSLLLFSVLPILAVIGAGVLIVLTYLKVNSISRNVGAASKVQKEDLNEIQ
jgi:hypothetical protein